MFPGKLAKGLVSVYVVHQGSQRDGPCRRGRQAHAVCRARTTMICYVGVVRHAVSVVFWNRTDVASQSTQNGSTWGGRLFRAKGSR